MVVVRGVAKHRDYGKDALVPILAMTALLPTPLAMPIPEAATPFQTLIHGPWAPGTSQMIGLLG